MNKCDFCQLREEERIIMVEANGRRPICIRCIRVIARIAFDNIAYIALKDIS